VMPRRFLPFSLARAPFLPSAVPDPIILRSLQAIFDWIFSVPSRPGDAAAAADNNDDTKYELHYLSSPNVGLDDAALEARRQREASSLASVRTLSAVHSGSLSDVWKFLHTEHDLYAAALLVARSGSNSNQEEEAPAGEHVGAAAHDASTPPYGLSPNDAVIKSYGA
jgi:hypothetical protein